MPSGQALHQQAEIRSIGARVDDEVDVIGHQAIAVDLEPELAPELLQRFQVGASIGVGDEHRAPVVTALNDMVRIVGHADA